MKLGVGLLLLGLCGCVPELQPPLSGKPAAPSALPSPTPSVVPEATPIPSATPTPMVVVELWAGHPIEAGYADGQGKDARFNAPIDLAIDANSNLYVADNNNNRIRKITPEAQVSTVAGSGLTGPNDGPALKAQMYMPRHLVWLSNGDIWFYDSRNIRKLDLNRQVSTIMAGALDPDYTGPKPPPFPLLGANACWGAGMALGPDGYVYAVDGNYVCRLEANGHVTKMAGKAGGPGYEVILTLDGPVKESILGAGDLAFDPQGNIYISDLRSHMIRKISKDWSTITTVAGDAKACQAEYDKLTACQYVPPEQRLPGQPIPYNLCLGVGECARGHRDGPASQALFHGPGGLAFDPQGNLYVADSYNHAIRKLSPDGMVSTIVKLPDRSFPEDIVCDKQGNFYVATSYAIYKFRVP